MEESKALAQGQMDEGEVKRSKTLAAEESSDAASESNPFVTEPDNVMKLLKIVEQASQLKELRKMCPNWDEYNLKELEDRAFNGKLKTIDFFWTHKFNTKAEAEANLVQFMEDTSAIPQLFTSFRFNFPESWTILENHMDFFSIYPVRFVHLGIPTWAVQLELLGEFFTKFMKSDIWSNLKEITIYSTGQPKEIFGHPSSSLFVPGSGNMERKLEKLDIKSLFYVDSPILRIFESAFASEDEKYTNLASIGLFYLKSWNLDFPGLDPSKLTRLEINEIQKGSTPALEFTSGLIKLAGNGMRLKNFCMRVDVNADGVKPQNYEIFFEKLRLICSNLTQFLTSQSSTLEDFTFSFVCYSEDPMDVPEEAEIWCKIHLPEFEVLHKLKLKVDLKLIEENSSRIHTQLFGMSEYPSVHFPKLVNLSLDGESSLIALRVNPAPEQAGQLHLKRLKIIEYDNFSNVWNTSFVGVIGSVEELECPAQLLYGERHPWGESLRQLHINNTFVVVEPLFVKMNHFKNLVMLSTKYRVVNGHILNGCLRRAANNHYRKSMKVEDYLATFKEATELPLTSIEFISQRMKGEMVEEIVEEVKEMKEKFIQYFPYPVQFYVEQFIF